MKSYFQFRKVYFKEDKQMQNTKYFFYLVAEKTFELFMKDF